MRELLLTFLLALVAGSIINGYLQPGNNSNPSSSQAGGPPGQTNLILDTSDAGFATDVLNAEVPVMVDFWADWCGPCKKMQPVVESLASQYEGKLRVVKLNIDANPSTTATFNVKQIPTFIFFQEGRPLETVVGAASRERLVETAERLITSDN